MKRTLCTVVSLLMTALMLNASAPLAMAGNEFGAIYIGNYDDEDADVFRKKMLALGWKQELWKTSNSTIRSMKPAHFHFTDGIDGRLTEAGDDCDLLYISGHGWNRAKFPIYWSKGASSPYDSISADSNCVGGPAVHPWEVGVDWAGKFPSNQSRWDTDIEWAIFAACSQLDYRTTSSRLAYSNSWPRNSSAKTWARTLLGEPGRMHAIFGYWDTAPAGTTDVAVIREFLYQAVDRDATLGDAWARANSKYGLPWAFVTHAENRNDRLHGQGPGATPDTRPDAEYHIDYYRSGVVARMLDGRGGRYEQMSDAGKGILDRALVRTREWLGVDSAHARKPSTVRVGRVLLPRAYSVPRRIVTLGESKPAQMDIRRVRSAFLGSSDASAAIQVRPNGELEVRTGRAAGDRPVGDSMQQAVALARECVSEAGHAFEGAIVTEVHAVTRSRVDLDEHGPDPEEIVQYKVKFSQSVGGHRLTGPGVGLELTLDGEGVSDVVGYLVDVDSLSETGDRTPIDASESLLRRGSLDDTVKMGEGDQRIARVELTYHLDPSGDTTPRPVWSYSLVEGAEFHADAFTGRQP